jgi:hypothetical protein
MKKVCREVLGLTPMIEQDGWALFAMPNGTMLDLFEPATGPENAPEAAISSPTLAPMLNPTTTSPLTSAASSAASRARSSMLKSSGGGVPACPGSVTATRRTDASAG